MPVDDQLVLISQIYTQDAIGGQVPTEARTAVWASIRSVTRRDEADAGVRGLKAEYVAVTHLANYSGQEAAELQGRRYGIYRTYIIPGTDSIELYLERKGGA